MAEFGRSSSYPFRVREICRPGTDGRPAIPDNIRASRMDARPAHVPAKAGPGLDPGWHRFTAKNMRDSRVLEGVPIPRERERLLRHRGGGAEVAAVRSNAELLSTETK